MNSALEPFSCSCYNPQAHFTVFDEESIGTEAEHYGDVSLLTCKHCQKIWLRFLLEYEFQTMAGRYYRGLIDENIAGQVTPDTAAVILESLDWCFFGGSWFNHAGQRSQGPVKIAFM